MQIKEGAGTINCQLIDLNDGIHRKCGMHIIISVINLYHHQALYEPKHNYQKRKIKAIKKLKLPWVPIAGRGKVAYSLNSFCIRC